MIQTLTAKRFGFFALHLNVQVETDANPDKDVDADENAET